MEGCRNAKFNETLISCIHTVIYRPLLRHDSGITIYIAAITVLGQSPAGTKVSTEAEDIVRIRHQATTSETM
jgi:hypothetical protein